MGGVSFNKDLAGKPEGQARLGELIIGVIAMACTVAATDGKAPGLADFDAYWYSVIIVWSIIAILCVLAFLGIEIDLLTKADGIFHACACVLLIVSASFFLAALCENKCGGQKYQDLAISGGVFGLLFGILCGAQAGFLFGGI